MFFRGQTDKKTDEELLSLYQATRDLECLSTLYLRYTSLVYGVCLQYLKDRDEAKDAVMQIHEKLIEGLLQHSVRNFKSWLYATTRNHCLMQLRAERQHPTEEISISFMENGLAEHPLEEVMRSEASALEKCLQTLPGPQHRCVTLFYLEEKCYKEITALTGFDHNEVKSYIQNGKRNLKNCLERHGE